MSQFRGTIRVPVVAANPGSGSAGQVIYNSTTGTYYGWSAVSSAWVDLTGPRLSALTNTSVLDTGVSGQIRAGRQLAVADFTTMLGGSTPVGLWNLSDLTNLGTGGALTNKNSATFGVGINGAATTCVQLAGPSNQVLYITDTGATTDPFRIKTGSWGAWARTTRRSSAQGIVTKTGKAPNWCWSLELTGTNVARAAISLTGSAAVVADGLTDIGDDRWHFYVCTYDGNVLRLYVDAVMEGQVTTSGSIFTGGASVASPLNIGGWAADASTSPTSPFYGRIDEAFVTSDVLDGDQIRLLMCAKTAHGQAAIPVDAALTVNRYRKGGIPLTTNFSATPRRLYSLANVLTDSGLDAATLTASGSPPVATAGPDGSTNGAYQFVAASSQYLTTASDTNLPMTTTASSQGAWFKTSSSGVLTILSWGASGGRRSFYHDSANGGVRFFDGVNVTASTALANDGQWHFGVAVCDNAALDGFKVKLYLDGRLVGVQSVLASTTTGGFFIARDYSAGTSYFDGTISRAFVTTYAMASEEIAALYAKRSTLGLPTSFKSAGDHIEAIDTTNLYHLFDSLDSQHTVNLTTTL